MPQGRQSNRRTKTKGTEDKVTEKHGKTECT